MSHDLSIWCVRPLRSHTALPDAEKWDASGSCWLLDGNEWLLSTGPSDCVVPEDVPEEVVGAFPGIRHVVYLSLEPNAAPQAGHDALSSTAREIAKIARGVIFDSIEGTVQVLSDEEYDSVPGHKSASLRAALARLERITHLLRDMLWPKSRPRDPQATTEKSRTSVLILSWWFERDGLVSRDVIDRILNVLNTHVPEALPKRYGLLEPPPYTLEKTGRKHFTGFLAEHLSDSIVWQTEHPVTGVAVNIRHECGWQQIGTSFEYRCNYFSLQIDAEALVQSGWQTVLRRMWRLLSTELRPFFGEVRTLKGYVRMGDRVMSDSATEPNPTRSGWWQGIPPRLGHAAVVGQPYLNLWPAFKQQTEPILDGLGFLSTADWTTEEDAADLVGGVPQEIALPALPYLKMNRLGGVETIYPQEYPPQFPFGSPQGDFEG